MPLNLEELRGQLAAADWTLPHPLEELGRGGSGIVYKCYRHSFVNSIAGLTDFRGSYPHLQHQHRAPFGIAAAKVLEAWKGEHTTGALKVVDSDPAWSQEVVASRAARFAREVEAIRRVRHHALVSAIAVDSSPTPSWFVMEYFRRKHIQFPGSPFKGKALTVLKQARTIAAGLGHLHSLSYVHRDIKPKNIFLREDGDWVLGDLGSAHQDNDTRLTEAHDVMGSRDWMPDWMGGKREPQPHDDLFMLAKTIYALIADDNPRTSQVERQSEQRLANKLKYQELHAVDDFLLPHLVTDEKSFPSKTCEEFIRRMDQLIGAFERKFQPTLLIQQVTGLANRPALPPGTSVPVFIPAGCRKLVGRMLPDPQRNRDPTWVGFILQRGPTESRESNKVQIPPFMNGPAPWSEPLEIEIPWDWPTDAWYHLSYNVIGISGWTVYAV